MNKENFKEFALLMAKLEEAFSETITKEKITLYFDYLNDLSIEQVARAIDFIIVNRTWKSIPTIAEIHAATLGSMEYKAVEAWGELLGTTYDIEKKFKNALIPKVAKVAFGNLEAFYSGDNRNDMADRAHFIKAYQLIANLEEANNEHRRLKTTETKLIEKR